MHADYLLRNKIDLGGLALHFGREDDATAHYKENIP